MSEAKKMSVAHLALRQCALLGRAVLMLLGGGLIVNMWHKRLHTRAMMAAMLLLVWPAFVLLALPQKALCAPWWLLWGGVLSTAVTAGAAAARISRHLALWELYGAVVANAAITFAVVARPVTAPSGSHGRILPMGPEPLFGASLLGPLWDRLLLLSAPLMFAASVLGASFAVLFWGLGRGKRNLQRDWGFVCECRIAVRHLAGARAQALSTTAKVTLLGVALGVASLIVVTAVMSGYQDDIEAKILNTNAHLVLQKYGVDFNEHEHVARVAKQTAGVVAAAPFAFNEAMLSAQGRGLGVLLKGIDATLSAAVTDSAQNLCVPGPAPSETLDALDVRSTASRCRRANKQGNALLQKLLSGQGEAPPAVVVGIHLFRKLGVEVGSVVHLMTPVGMAGIRGGAPKRMAFTLAGVFASGMHEFDSHLVYVALPHAQALLGLGQSVSGVEMRLRDPRDVKAVAQQLLQQLGQYPYRTLDWRELNASIFMALSLQKVVMFLVLTFIVVVAAFNIASTLFMAVVEKGPQVAILQGLGATRASIMKIFVIEGWITGASGTALGTLLGCLVTKVLARLHVGIASDVYMVDALTVHLAAHEVLITVAAALSICHLATLYPSLQATRGTPIELLRRG